jgi:gliding motility-associated-like protein
VDGGTSRFDRRAFIYQSVCASCGSNNAFPTMPGAYSTNNNSANCNNAIIKMDVSVHPIAKANLTGPTIGCAPFTVPFNTTGSVASDYLWNFGDGSPSDTVKNTSHTYTAVGTFTVTLYALDSLGVCVYIDSSKLVITVGNPPDLFITPEHNLCFGDAGGTATVAANGGFNPYSYLWTNTQTTITATGLSANTYTVLVTDSVGCQSTETITITEPGPIVGGVINSTNVNCKGGNDGSATASASGGTGTLTYAWSTNPVQVGPVANNLTAGTYTVTMSDANACSVTDTITIFEPPGMTLTSITTLCGCGVQNGSADVSASGGLAPYTYLWLVSPVQTTPTISGLGVGSYSVIITDSKGCLEVQMVAINGVAPPQADFYYTPEFVSYLDPVVSFYDASSDDPYYWSWNFGDPTSGMYDSSTVQNPGHTYSDTGSYCITLIVYDSTRVCVDTTIKCLKIEPEFTFYIPNAFTPNSNGLNEIFYGYGTYIKEFEIMIFDRWGNLIFESNDMLKGWDGKVQGGKSAEMVQEDVYVWKVRILDVRDNVHKYIGHVSTAK